MAVHYEWDVEVSAGQDTDDLDAGDIVDHWFCDSFAQAKAEALTAPDDGFVKTIVLIRHDDEGSNWAYFEDGKLPAFFQDAYQNDTAKVPKRFHAEILKA